MPERCNICETAGYLVHHPYCPNKPRHDMTNEIAKPKAEDMQVVLEALLVKLQEIDENAATRGAHATNIIYGQMHGFDKPVFDDEIRLVRKALNLPDTAPPAQPIQLIAAGESRFSMEL